jgi:hypothetical protein
MSLVAHDSGSSIYRISMVPAALLACLNFLFYLHDVATCRWYTARLHNTLYWESSHLLEQAHLLLYKLDSSRPAPTPGLMPV